MSEAPKYEYKVYETAEVFLPEGWYSIAELKSILDEHDRMSASMKLMFTEPQGNA